MNRRRFWATLVVAMGLLATAAGCAQPGQWDDMSQPAAPYAPPTDWDGPFGDACDANWLDQPQDAPPMEPLSADAVLVHASRCVYTMERVPDEGEWMVRTDQEATTGLESLAEALRVPSEPRDENQMCLAIAYATIVLTVTDATGRQFHPTVPTTSCGAPLPVATDAIAALPWTTVGTARVHQLRSELEITSGCPGEYKAMIALTAAETHIDTRVSIVDPTPRPLDVCRFEVSAEEVALADRGEYDVGDLVAASTLDPAAAHELLAAVATAPPAQPCIEPSSFVVINEAGGGALELMVEVDGCYRATVGAENYVRQLDPDLVARVLG